jgi:hypothetical protein
MLSVRNTTCGCLLLGIAFFPLIFGIPLRGDDGAASVAAGGIVLRKEPRISMERERLTIGMTKVTVDFDFLNESQENITTAVGFPVPTYQWPYMGSEIIPNFPDFRVWVNGRELKYKTDLKAVRNGQDYAVLLREMGVNIETFGDFDVYEGATQKQNQILPLTPEQKARLLQLGLLDRSGDGSYSPHWSVSKMYYWEQDFPAQQIVHIRHEYTPVAGAGNIPAEYFDRGVRTHAIQTEKADPQGSEYAKGISEMIRDGCVDPGLERRLSFPTKSGFVFVNYVNYILTSANTWKTPIHDFELHIDQTIPGSNDSVHTSFCWDGAVQHADANHFVAKKVNFTPTKEFVVYFFRR